MTNDSDHIVTESAARIFADLADPQTINRLDDGAWKAPFWQALADAGLDAQAIDLIVLATSTPDNTFPATAVAVQHGLGINHGAAFDLQAVCSGFVFALATADNFLRAGAFKRALVIGAETFSRILDWNDRGTCVLFGDGAGAVVLEAQ